jgi:hypothetical protein
MLFERARCQLPQKSTLSLFRITLLLEPQQPHRRSLDQPAREPHGVRRVELEAACCAIGAVEAQPDRFAIIGDGSSIELIDRPIVELDASAQPYCRMGYSHDSTVAFLASIHSAIQRRPDKNRRPNHGCPLGVELLSLTEFHDGSLQCLDAGVPERCGCGIEPMILLGQCRDTLAVTVAMPWYPGKLW